MLLVAVNALVGGTLGQERTVLADAYCIRVAVILVGVLTALSGILVAVRMRATDHKPAI